MGKCFSSCFGSPCAQENGRPSLPKIQSSKTQFTPIHTVNTNIDTVTVAPPVSTQVSHSTLDEVDPGKTQPCVEKKMFGSHSRLPQMRKSTSSTDSRRISFNSKEPSESKISALFEQYKDGDEDAILADGIERFCNDLNVKPEEFRVLVLAWKFDAETMCRFTRSEFTNGCKLLKADSIKGIQSKFADMLKEVNKAEHFKEFYKWTYRFGLDKDQGQRTLSTDIAVILWKLVFTHREPPILKRWLNFLEDHPDIRGIPRDTWDMFLHFVDNVGDDLGLYDDTEAWPSLLDDFVEYENDRQNQNVCTKGPVEDMVQVFV